MIDNGMTPDHARSVVRGHGSTHRKGEPMRMLPMIAAGVVAGTALLAAPAAHAWPNYGHEWRPDCRPWISDPYNPHVQSAMVKPDGHRWRSLDYGHRWLEVRGYITQLRHTTVVYCVVKHPSVRDLPAALR